MSRAIVSALDAGRVVTDLQSVLVERTLESTSAHVCLATMAAVSVETAFVSMHHNDVAAILTNHVEASV